MKKRLCVLFSLADDWINKGKVHILSWQKYILPLLYEVYERVETSFQPFESDKN